MKSTSGPAMSADESFQGAAGSRYLSVEYIGAAKYPLIGVSLHRYAKAGTFQLVSKGHRASTSIVT